MQFVVDLESIDDMPVYKFEIKKDGELIEKESISYKEFTDIIKVNNTKKILA